MKTAQDLINYLKSNKRIILSDSLGHQQLIKFEEKTSRIYYLNWSPRENTGDPREYITYDQAIALIKKFKPQLLTL